MPITCHSFGTRITFWGSAFPKFVCDGGGTNGKREKKAEECIWWVKDKSDVAWRLHGKQLASTSPPPHCFQLLRDFECWMSHWRVMSECAQKTNILNDCFILKDGTFFFFFPPQLTNVVFFFARHRVAAYFPILNGCQIPAKGQRHVGTKTRKYVYCLTTNVHDQIFILVMFAKLGQNSFRHYKCALKCGLTFSQ